MATASISAPIPLIEIEPNEKLTANEIAVDLLRSMDPELKVCVVCVCGIYRSGKSSLMNWLLGIDTWSVEAKKGFVVGPSINRCTRGIWMWGAPRRGTLPSGEECMVVVLDTEGIGGVESNSQYDARIFSLALLLCSSLIYNSMGSIDEAAISNLSFVAQLSNHIRISGSAEQQDESVNFNKIFPTFLWVIRDFALDLVDEDGDSMSELQYLNRALNQVKGFDKQTVERNRIRSMLSSFFSHRQCLTLVRPCSDEGALQQIDNVPFDELRPEFQKAVGRLRQLVFDQLVPKVLNDRSLNGLMFAGLVESYTNAINQGGVPTLSTAWDSISQEECSAAFEGAVRLYENEMDVCCGKSELPIESKRLQDLHEQKKAEALRFYKHRAVGAATGDFMDKVDARISELLTEYVELNYFQSSESCSRMLETLFSSRLALMLTEKSILEADFVANFKKEWEALAENYQKASSKGPAADKILASFYHNRFLNCIEMYSVCTRDFYGREMRKVLDENRDLSSALSIVTTERNVLNSSNIERESKLNDTERNLRNAASRCNQQESLIAETTEKLRSSKKLEEELKDLLERADAKSAALSAKIAENATALKELENLKIFIGRQADQIDALQAEVEAKAKEEAIRKERKAEKKKCVVS